MRNSIRVAEMAAIAMSATRIEFRDCTIVSEHLFFIFNPKSQHILKDYVYYPCILTNFF